jgi:hypothetical protein
MYIMTVLINTVQDIQHVEMEVCRLLRCKSGMCAAMHTEMFVRFRNSLYGLCINRDNGSDPERCHLPEGLVLQVVGSTVEFSWLYCQGL